MLKNGVPIICLVFLASFAWSGEKPIKPEKLEKLVEVKYNKYENYTTISNKNAYIHMDNEFQLKTPEGKKTHLDLKVWALWMGKNPKLGTPTITFELDYKSDYGLIYYDCHDLTLLVDDKKMTLNQSEYDSTLNGFEFIRVEISRNQLKRLANARKVEGQICNAEFVLNQKHFWLLKRVLQEITNPSKLNAEEGAKPK